MHHIPKPQDQARILEKALKTLNIDVKHQDALQLIAKVMGHKDWKTMSAAMDSATTPEPVAAIPHTVAKLFGPEDGDVYEGLVTVDMTLSCNMKVRANSLEEAQRLLREAGQAQYPLGFDVDENYRGSSDFYIGDPDSVENLSQVEFDRDGDYYGNASWADERFSYRLDLSRDEPDSSDEEEWSKATLTITVKDEKGNKVSKDFDYEVHNSNLAEYLEESLDEGDFDEDLDELIEQLEKKLNQ